MSGLLNILLRSGILTLPNRFYPNTLTVLNYHRVDDTSRLGFDTFAPNVSASRAEFDRQMDFLQTYHNIISCNDLLLWIYGDRNLPPNPALITFDDGYSDNFHNAYPVLKARNLPAVIFLTTSFIGKDTPFYWDFISYSFFHTKKTLVKLPLMASPSTLIEPNQRRRVMLEWIGLIKQVSEVEKKAIMKELLEKLEISIPDNIFSGLTLSWDQVREMSQNGIDFGSHTSGHPILTRIPLPQIKDELVGSKQLIENEIGKTVNSLAYPNGSRLDYSKEIIEIVKQSGYEIAFTLINGTNHFYEIRNHPFEIKRIFISGSDTLSRFAAKLAWRRFKSE